MEEQIQQVSSSPIESSSTQKPYAGIIIRWAASIVDGILSFLVSLPFLFIFVLLGFGYNKNRLDLINGIVVASYFVILTKMYGATWGKKFFKLKVQTIGGTPITWLKAFLREVVGKIISSIVLMLGFVWALFDKKKQTWHDKIAGTIVVQDQPLSKGRKICAYIIALIIPIAVLGILAAVVLVAVNPAEQLRRSKASQEKTKQVQEDSQKRMDELNQMYDPQNIVETPATSY
jgi:uncharacterized RDD family membrane protein YckC